MSAKQNFLNSIRRKPLFEDLESRICLDGSIQVEIVEMEGLAGKTAFVTGDAAANSLRIQQTGMNSYRLEGRFVGAHDTTVNGANFHNVTGIRNIVIDLKGGDDKIYVNGDTSKGASERLALNGELRIIDSSGNSNVVIEDATIRGDLRCIFVEGDNSVQLIDSRINGKASILGGWSKDFVGLFNSTFADSFYARLGAGADSILSGSTEHDLTGSRFLGSFHVSTGNGADSVKLDRSQFESTVRVRTGNGNDTVESTTSRFISDSSFDIITGNHGDQVNLEDLYIKNFSTTIRLGGGTDNLTISNLRDNSMEVVGGLNINGGANKDTILVQGSRLARTTRINGNGGTDHLTVKNTRVTGESGELNINGGANKDTIRIEESVLQGNTRLRGNGGNDDIIVMRTRFRDTMPDNDDETPQRPMVSLYGGPGADFTSLIDLIISTTSRESPVEWNGNGPNDRYVAENIDMIVKSTKEVEQEVKDLLNSLRQLQDLQITIEVKFITVNDSFFEEIGIDFDFDISSNSGTIKYEIQDSKNGNTFFGRTKITDDLDIRFRQGSFETGVPQFGGFDAGNANNFGFAILSDIETFFHIQATVGDTRSNILSAPKVTLFNGQFATVTAGTERPY